MSPLQPFDALSVRLVSLDGADAAVPAEAFARVLTGLQRALYALAVGMHRAVLGDRPLRQGAAFRRRYALRCLARLDATGAMPLAFGPRQLELELELGLSPDEVATRFFALWSALAEGRMPSGLDEDTGRACLSEMARALPRGHEAWAVALRLAEAPERRIDARMASRLEGLALPAATRGAVAMTVVGEVCGLDFVAGTFTFRHGPSGHLLSGRYAPDQEVFLLKQRRKPVLVSGLFALDADGQPRALRRLQRIAALDLAPIAIAEMEHQDRRWTLVPPLVLELALDEASACFEARDEALGIAAEAESREALEDEIRRQIVGWWERFDRGEADALARAWWRRLSEAAQV